MTQKEDKKKLPGQKHGSPEEVDLQGYPLYPSSEDIYSKFREEKEINPEDISKVKQPNETAKAGEIKTGKSIGNPSGDDLDVPGSELDDEQENIGAEDEENNYYSLGGDVHNP
jgi:hypothetical protein